MGWRRTCATDRKLCYAFSSRNLRPTKENSHGTNNNLLLQTKSDLSHFVCKTSNETHRTRVPCIAERDVVETDDGASSDQGPSSKVFEVQSDTEVGLQRITVNLMKKTMYMVKNEVVRLKLFLICSHSSTAQLLEFFAERHETCEVCTRSPTHQPTKLTHESPK